MGYKIEMKQKTSAVQEKSSNWFAQQQTQNLVSSFEEKCVKTISLAERRSYVLCFVRNVEEISKCSLNMQYKSDAQLCQFKDKKNAMNTQRLMILRMF